MVWGHIIIITSHFSFVNKKSDSHKKRRKNKKKEKKDFQRKLESRKGLKTRHWNCLLWYLSYPSLPSSFLFLFPWLFLSSSQKTVGERREWIKPIMFSGGLGSIDAEFTQKKDAQKDMLVVKVGGPVYRIGVGGGAASSTEVQGN